MLQTVAVDLDDDDYDDLIVSTAQSNVRTGNVYVCKNVPAKWGPGSVTHPGPAWREPTSCIANDRSPNDVSANDCIARESRMLGGECEKAVFAAVCWQNGEKNFFV